MKHRTLSRSLFSLTVVLIIMSALFLVGCDDDDDDDFEDVDASEIQNRTYVFPDARAFGLTNLEATLTIDQFGTTPSGDTDDAPFTLVSGTSTLTGILDLGNQPIDSIPIGSSQTDCNFGIDTSTFTTDGLRVGDTITTMCRLTQGDATELQITNQGTNQVSTGTLQ
jgi:hypothetical protein